MRAFNLNEAKAGKAVVFENGTTAKFIAHVPEAAPTGRVLVARDFKPERIPFVVYFREDGTAPDYQSLKMAPEKRTVWVNIYSERVNKNHDGVPSGVWETRRIVDAAALDDKRIACVPVTFTEGEGL